MIRLWEVATTHEQASELVIFFMFHAAWHKEEYPTSFKLMMWVMI
jgi:hypothetical protein